MKAMSDDETSVAELKKRMQKFVSERNWNKYHEPKELATAINIEASELCELFLFQQFKIEEIISDEVLFGNIKDEIADIFAYLLSIINALDIDLTSIFLEKMKKNDIKYPKSKFNGNYTKQS